MYNNHKQNFHKTKCIIPNNTYPELKPIFDKRYLIRDELVNIIKSDKWTKWDGWDKYDSTPTFTRMSETEILERLRTNASKLNSGEASWRIYGLMLDKNKIEDNTKEMPKLMAILDSIPNIINAGISVLEPNVQTERHRDYSRTFYRAHIPLIIPKGDTYLEVDGQILKWNMDEYFIFDDTCMHYAQNKTKENRFVLIVDIAR
jgi:beta-hydroxylase